MTVKLNTPVSYNGEITTINELDKKGLIEYKEIKNFYTPRNGLQTKYFADINLGINTGWEIGKFAYMSKTGGIIKI